MGHRPDATRGSGPDIFDNFWGWARYRGFYAPLLDAAAGGGGGSGWADDPADLVLDIIRDCFKKGDAARETTYSLHKRNGENPTGTNYRIYENHTNPYLTGNNLGFSSQENIFEDKIGTGGVLGDVSSLRYWTITDGTNWYGMVPVRADGKEYKVEGIWMHGDRNPDKTQVFLNGTLAPPCP